ncbi:phosphatase PTC7-like protein [Thalictrum thalictroides]|uniref:Protein phosphatase n=1 Tax=Thalictrum thalictroides TaxID=46969 RepID=A0A7J6V7X6_THATH|nr:phosphatase PTC7-like protein [Thalictrum thalictroides]
MPSNFSKLNLALRSGFRRPISGIQGGLKNSVGLLIGHGKLLFGNSGSSLAESFSTLAEVQSLLRPSTVYAARSDLQVANQPKNLSFIGALSRTFSVLSVSGLPFHACGYDLDQLLLEPSQVPLGNAFQKLSTAACGSNAVLDDCCKDNLSLKNVQLTDSKRKPNHTYSGKTIDCCQKLSAGLLNQGPSNNRLVHGYSFYDSAKINCNLHPFGRSKDFHSVSSAFYSTAAATEVSFDKSAYEEQLRNSADSSDQKVVGDRSLKLLSGSCYLPHPDKEETGGEDAHFICVDEQAIGVADGVGGWADLGVDAGQYARELMSNSVTAIEEEPKGLIDPARVLEKAHSSTKAKGSSTACIIALTEKGIHAINLGDSGFILVRDGCTVFRSPVQQHGFNFTYQLESGNDGDLPSSGEVFNVPVVSGDVIIAGTDGLFDNLYNNEVTAVVVHAVRAGLAPQVTAQKIAALARQRAQDSDRQTPFSTAAQDAGFRYYGGKLDDITVVVSYITSSSSA